MSSFNMGQQAFFCSELSRGVGERVFGTASIGRTWLLLEYPFGWGSKALRDSNLSQPIKDHINRAVESTPRSRFLFIKQTSVCRDTVALFVVKSCTPEPRVLKIELQDYKQLLDLDLKAIVAGATDRGGEAFEEPLYLVCTHGKRDKCCAKFGIALYKSMREHAGEKVWQSSHVGGDRFAANLVCFPHGLFYARVDEEAGRRITSEYESGHIVLPNYRGRSCYSYHVQAAEYFARSESGLVGLDDMRLAGGERAGENLWRIRFEARGAGEFHEAEVSRHMSDFRNFITCHATDEKRVAQYRLEAYRVLQTTS